MIRANLAISSRAKQLIAGFLASGGQVWACYYDLDTQQSSAGHITTALDTGYVSITQGVVTALRECDVIYMIEGTTPSVVERHLAVNDTVTGLGTDNWNMIIL